MTRNKMLILRFLSDKMEATAEMIGRHLLGDNCTYSTRSAAAILGFLREHDLVMRIPELNAWRLTKKGRDMVSKAGGGE